MPLYNYMILFVILNTKTLNLYNNQDKCLDDKYILINMNMYIIFAVKHSTMDV